MPVPIPIPIRRHFSVVRDVDLPLIAGHEVLPFRIIPVSLALGHLLDKVKVSELVWCCQTGW
jgi:hypothetical protein